MQRIQRSNYYKLLITYFVILLHNPTLYNALWYGITRGVIMIRIKLSALLGERRMTQAELARRTGIRPATINEIYHELIERINLEHIDKICETLGCDISDLFKYEPQNSKNT